MSTEYALKFLLEYYAKQKRGDLIKEEQWELLKKYKNPMGHTCRDFFNEFCNEKAIVVHDKSAETMSVIEDKNFLFFMDNAQIKPLYVYAPFVFNNGDGNHTGGNINKINNINTNKIGNNKTNKEVNGISFCFALWKNLKEEEIITLGNERLSDALLEKLKSIFIGKSLLKDKNIIVKNDKMIVITNYDINIITDRLEQNNIKFDSDIFTFYKNSSYKPIYPDLLDIKYHFPQDENKTSLQAMESIFNILSKSEINDENYTRIRKLFRKMDIADLNCSRKTALDINLKENNKIETIYEFELKRRKIKKFFE